MVSVSSGFIIFLGGVGLYLAIPALNREIITSRFVSEALRDIKTDCENSQSVLTLITQNLEESPQTLSLSKLILFTHKPEEYDGVSVASLSDHILVIIR